MNNDFRGFRVALVECTGKFCPDPSKDRDVGVFLKMDVSKPAVFAHKKPCRATDVFIVAGIAKKIEHCLVQLHDRVQVWSPGNLVVSNCNIAKSLFLFRGGSDSTGSGHQSKQSTAQLDPQELTFIVDPGDFDAFAGEDFNQSFSGESLQ